MLTSITLEVVGEQRLACEGCENRVTRLLKALNGVERVRARASNQRIDIQFDPSVVDAGGIADRLRRAGYESRRAPSTRDQST